MNTKTEKSTASVQITEAFLSLRNDEQAAHLMRFFKTAPGQYGEGDKFLGIRVPVTRSLAKKFSNDVTLHDCDILLGSEWHEIRLVALLLMIKLAQKCAKARDLEGLKQIIGLYDRRLERVNNWDLVDLSVRDLMGIYWKCTKDDYEARRLFLSRWATSGHLWRERAAMVSVYPLLRMGSLDETFWLAEHFINHRHDLMHKAVGWMLREAGKVDRDALRQFLNSFCTQLPRPTLRYAIEHFSPDEREIYMKQ